MPSWRKDLLALWPFPALLLVLHFVLGNRYGFHRDELQFLSDARHLASGYVAYPPMTSLLGRLGIAVGGLSPSALRLPAALVNGATLLLAGGIAREMGGRRSAQLVTLAAMLPVTVVFSSVLQYNTPDLFAWTLLVFATARVLRKGDERWWLGAGVAVGLGELSKYSIAFGVAGLLLGLVALPSQRRRLRSPWFWAGALAALVIAAPNLLWLVRHHGITLTMEGWIHRRDIRLGRTRGYWTDQLRYTLLALPLALAGIAFLLRSPRFRLLSAFFLGPLFLFAAAQGRGYYLLPAYTVLYAAGAVALERWLEGRCAPVRRLGLGCALAAMLLNVLPIGALYLPVFSAGSKAWHWQVRANSDMADQVGWPEFVAQVAEVRDHLPAGDRTRLAVLANNYGEAGALELYGPAYGLPAPISSVNSFFLRGYGPYEPETLIVVGSTLEDQLKNFERCTVVGTVAMPFGIANEESRDHPEILVCRHLRGRWPEVWSKAQSFG